MYPLNLRLVEFLQSSQAQAVLDELAHQDLGEHASLDLLTRLRRTWPAEQAAALLDQARLRRRAGDKFPHPERLLFTDNALQQASSRAVATYRAQQFAAALNRSPISAHRSPLTLADLGCGIGADTIALAEAGLRVLAVERDPVLARIAAVNVNALGLAGYVQVICADWLTLFPWQTAQHGPKPDAVFLDPNRRAGEKRIFRLDAMDPPISTVLALLDFVPTLAVKTLPGIADDDIPPNAEVDFISERGAMKEALLRFGDLRNGAARQATLLPGPNRLDSNARLDHTPVTEPLAYLYEPDAAVIRATLVQHLATQIGAAQLDPTIAYLTSKQPAETPFGRRWAVLRHGPFHLKTLNRWLRELGAGAVVIKKRGSAIDPDEFRRRLRTTPGEPAVTVFLTRVQGQPWMVLCDAGEAHG
jgi:hypothetical protein